MRQIRLSNRFGSAQRPGRFGQDFRLGKIVVSAPLNNNFSRNDLPAHKASDGK